MKKIQALVVAVALVSSLPAAAEMCTLDTVPAATLLVPYFEADIGDANDDGMADCDGVTTIFTINNALPQPALGHVTLWTDWSFPTVDFDIFLTGFDAVQVDLCQVIGRGSIPVTADAATDPDDTISPHQLNPEWDGSFPDCEFIFPFPDPVIVGSLLDRVQNGHAGFPVGSLPGGECVGEALNGAGLCDNGSCPAGTLARGYATIDNVNRCSVLFPSDLDYFVDGGQGVASNLNQLWGDFILLDSNNPEDPRMAIGPLVHVEADDTFNSGSTPTMNTFYGRYTAGGADNREPLGTGWAARYFNGPTIDTDFVVWRDSANGIDPSQGFTCGTGAGAGPGWNPLREQGMTCFDDMENAIEVCSPESDPPCFPLETQRLRIGSASLPVPFQSGTCHLNLNIPSPIISLEEGRPPAPESTIAQSYLLPLYSAASGVSIAGGGGAVELVTACETTELTIDISPVFFDGFESGDLAGWSSSTN